MIGAAPNLTKKEREYALAALKQQQLVAGPYTDEFERNFASHIKTKHAIAVNSCTAGLHLAYLALKEIGGYNTIALPAMTHVATGFAAVYAGLKIQWDDACVWDNEYTDKALNIESTPKHVGVYSFFPTKNMTTLEGGMIATDDDDIAEFCRHRRAFGYVKDGYEYDVPNLAFNYRMNEVEAAVGIAQLERLPQLQAQRNLNATFLADNLDGDVIGDAYCFNIYRDNRTEVMNWLQTHGIRASIHYPRPVPHMTYFSHKGSFPKAERIAKTAISLPVGAHLNVDDMTAIVKALKGV